MRGTNKGRQQGIYRRETRRENASGAWRASRYSCFRVSASLDINRGTKDKSCEIQLLDYRNM
jgi:hypothetical protein